MVGLYYHSKDCSSRIRNNLNCTPVSLEQHFLQFWNSSLKRSKNFTSPSNNQLTLKSKAFVPFGNLLRNLWGVLGGISRSCPVTSQKLPLCGNRQMQRILGQFFRSLLQNRRKFSEVAPEVRPAVHTAALRFTNVGKFWKFSGTIPKTF